MAGRQSGRGRRLGATALVTALACMGMLLGATPAAADSDSTTTPPVADDAVPPAVETAPPAAEAVPALAPRLVGTAISQRAFTVEVHGAGGIPLPAGQPAAVTWTDPATDVPTTAYVVVDEDGVARFQVRSWKSTVVTATVGSETVTLPVKVQPARSPVRWPRDAPRPRRLTDPDPAGIGTGPNAEILRIGEKRRASMTGRSWNPGCVPFSSLREVRINYWGTDGYRYRGTLIVRAGVAPRVREAFSRLYEIGYRLHSMHPVDTYGRSPRGVGANDYASMASGNTSMFNCRYIVGKESSRAWSPHAGGSALDINPWENPYLARGGTYPNTWWYQRGRPSPMVITWNSRVTRILRQHGWIWGGRYRDYHHFDFAG